jgi:hypothetical protein
MHAKYSSKLTKLFVGTAFFFLFILLTLTMTDSLSRGMRTYPGGAGGAGLRTARRNAGDGSDTRGIARRRQTLIRAS